ncbi:MAG: hypothetical protein HFJ28_02925 [Clostridia bacterium]|nr:hypothetical protein [Clostridia bacterium]
MSNDTKKNSVVQQQEDAMWEEYRNSPAVSAEESVSSASQEPAFEGEFHEEKLCKEGSPTSRCDIAGAPPHFYPADKAGQTTKDRRYRPKPKRSDAGKTHGKKGKSYKELKHAGLPPTLIDN